ncbi:hypothetical protein QJQ45_011000 [Haematococcus lacustris]|nr:hypothetical protein QJQ45_011000 [Haematococcus lacustris]
MKLPLLNWKPVYSSGLAASYPSLISLTLRFLDLSTCRLGRLVSHPALLPLLKHLDVCGTDIMNKAQPAPSPFIGIRLQQPRLCWGYWDFTPHLAPLAPHLTQLAVASVESNESGFVGSLSSLAAAVGSLTCLQSLELGINGVEAGYWFLTLLVPVLASLPSLHTLLLLQDTVHGDQVDVLLAATQITHLQVYSIGCLVSRVQGVSSLQLEAAGGARDSVGAEVLAAADLNLCERNKAGLEVKDLWLVRGSFDLLTAQYVSRSRPAAQQPPKPTVASSISGQEGSKGVKLDGVVTVVDAKHVSRHLDTPKEAGVVNEAVEQIAFADRILLNKTDLVDAASLGPLEARLQAINKMATITRFQRAQLSLTASSLALDLQRLELACAFLLTDRLWAVAMADLAQLAVGLHANTAQRRLLTTPSALYSPRPASLTPTASGPTAMGGQQGPGWVEKLEPFWQLLVTYVVEATAGTEHNLAWWMAAVKAGNAYLPDLATPLQWAQPMNAKKLVGAAAQYVQEVVSSLMQALVAAGEARCLRLHQQQGAASNVTSQGNGVTAAEEVSTMQAGVASGAAAAAEPGQGASGAAGAVTGAGAAGAGAAAEPVLTQPSSGPQHMGGVPDAATQAVNQASSPEPGESLAACQRAMMTMWQTISYDCIAYCPYMDVAAAAAAQPHLASDVAKACKAVLTKVNALSGEGASCGISGSSGTGVAQGQ